MGNTWPAACLCVHRAGKHLARSVPGKVIVRECMFRLQTGATFRVCEEPKMKLVTDMNMKEDSGGVDVDLGIEIPG